MRDRAKAKQLNPRRVQDRLKQVERILDGDPKKNILPKELTEEQRIDYLTLFAKLAKLLSDGDRIAAFKAKGGIFS